MAERRVETSFGSLRIHGWRDEWIEWAARLGVKLASSEAPVGRFVSTGEGRVYVKGGPLRGRTRARHTLRQRLFRIEPPRLAEYANLSWLSERLFQTPLPLAAATLQKGRAITYQFLVTEEVTPASDLKAFLLGNDGGRQAVLDELADELARMHALHFVHRDLFPRNVLVGDPRAPRRVYFLDAWRGGCRVQSRGAAYDLGCFFLHAPELMDEGEQRAFFERYSEARAAQGRPVASSLKRKLARERARLVRRLAREPGRLHGHAPPSPDWALPSG